jgi:hypothetical protein
MNVPPLVRSSPFPVRSGRMEREEVARLARIIEEAWLRAGHADVRAWVEETLVKMRDGARANESLFIVRSNLVDGLPPSARRMRAAA